MTLESAPSRWDGVDLLTRAIDHTRGALGLVTPTLLEAPTPCSAWDLGELLRHMDDSLEALEEAITVRRVQLSSRAVPSEDLVASLRERACRLLGEWSADDGADVTVDGRPVTGAVLGAAGALEVLVHGWDVDRACGTDRPLPEDLAARMLEVVPVLVTGADRPHRFAEPVPVAPDAPAGDRLLCLLGRAP